MIAIDFPIDTDPFACVTGGHTLAQAIVDTLREPLVVLDGQLRVVAASRSFHETFGIADEDIHGRHFHAIGDGEWDIPDLRAMLERILPEDFGMEGFEVEKDFAGIGRRRILLNARTVVYDDVSQKMILLGMVDVTAWRAAEAAMQDLLAQKELRLQEMQHRVANSLQIIASILLLKARRVQSEEARRDLRDAHRRVLSIGAIQEQLKAARYGETVAVGPYLERLCDTLAQSMIAPSRRIAVVVNADDGEAPTSDAESLGLIVTELLLNGIKHAFPGGRQRARIEVDYRTDGRNWRLEVSDNGVGLRPGTDGVMRSGLGTSIVTALAGKLSAHVEIDSDAAGTRVSVQRGKTIAIAT